MPKLPRPFKFHSMWLRDKECEQVIIKRWSKAKNINKKIILITLSMSLGKIFPNVIKTSFGKVEELTKENRNELERIKCKEVNFQDIDYELKFKPQ